MLLNHSCMQNAGSNFIQSTSSTAVHLHQHFRFFAPSKLLLDLWFARMLSTRMEIPGENPCTVIHTILNAKVNPTNE